MDDKREKDILILGAGAAGLACARKLHSAGVKKVAVLEARGRIGGRVHTRMIVGYAAEFGPEFIHGTPSFTLDLLEKHRIPFVDVMDRHVEMTQGKIAPSQFQEAFEKIRARIDPKRDLSIADFLNKQKDLDERVRDRIKSFVEGFHAADTTVMGEKALHLAGEANEGSLTGISMFRMPLGYARVFRALGEGLEIHLNSPVRKVRWKDKVEVTLQNGEVWRAKKVLLTLPLSILKTLDLNPLPPGFTDGLNEMRMGHVQRLLFIFKSRFWERLNRQEPTGFMQAPGGGDFPVWWTTSPVRTPYLVAWQGGPRAEKMTQWSLRKRATAALRTLSRMTGLPYTEILRETCRVHTHNWSLDPYSRGAYSYLARGGRGAWTRLREGFGGRLYFAGEAFADGSERGTVHGAIHSGLHAADVILSK